MRPQSAEKEGGEVPSYFSKTTAIFTLLKAIFSFRSRYFVFSFDDPSPFFQDMVNVFRKLLKRDES